MKKTFKALTGLVTAILVVMAAFTAFTSSAAKAEDVISTPTALDPSKMTYSKDNLDVTINGNAFTMRMKQNASVGYGELQLPMTIDLDKTPYLYVDAERMNTGWKVIVNYDNKFYPLDPTPVEAFLPYGASGVYRFNIATSINQTGVKKMTLWFYITDLDFDIYPGQENKVNGIYVADEKFVVPGNHHKTISTPTVLDPKDIVYLQSAVTVETSKHGLSATITRGFVPSYQYLNIGATIDFSAIKYLCANFNNSSGNTTFLIVDPVTNTSKEVGAFAKEADGLKQMDLSKTGFTGVKPVVISIIFSDSTYNKKLVLDSLYLTTADGKVPAALKPTSSSKTSPSQAPYESYPDTSSPDTGDPGESYPDTSTQPGDSTMPGEDSSGDSSDVASSVSGPGEGGGLGGLWWIWIVVAAVVVLAGGAGLYFFYFKKKV